MMVDTQNFSQNYAKVVARVWSDPSYFDELQADPAPLLAQAGIETKPDSKIYVVKVEPTGEGNVEKQVADWQKGDNSGTYYLWVPTKPDDLAGGVAADDTSTTCTPCSTCT